MIQYCSVINGVPQYDLTSVSGNGRYMVQDWLAHDDPLYKNDFSTAVWDPIEQVVRVTPVPRTLVEIKQRQSEKIKEAARPELDAIVAGYSVGEFAGFAIKLAEAKAYQASNNPLDAPWLASIAEEAEITLASFVAYILSKSQELMGANVPIEGKRIKLLNQIASATTAQEVLSVEW